ncbi:peptide deformylase [Carboxylicivirga mesophila]|uniref:Peptide deformylase n=1 Tax=Carboxylicivirga mesophila TaxID=1166478 RepID=A0ABS5KCR4_9BACT|nr:peptide deformylase [Carboxylicivirga mesophila]MBS2212288.1 peptide deformylase [Carboxylicivirga mesophila]
MALAITAYGTKVLRKVCDEITADYEGLQVLIDNMWETMYEAGGVGLAAPQVNKAIRLFTVDTVQVFEGMKEEDKEDLFEDEQPVKEVFINAKITGESDEVWADNEGCLSLPDLSGEVERPWAIEIEYYDRDFNKHKKTFTGYNARVIQHEYDHTEGILYVDHLSGISKRLLKGKLNKIAEGKVAPRYRMRFAK